VFKLLQRLIQCQNVVSRSGDDDIGFRSGNSGMWLIEELKLESLVDTEAILAGA
jgi:hypothetical protein